MTVQAMVIELVDDLTPLQHRAASLRAYYGRQGLTVYDRLDRWRQEHGQCDPDTHSGGVEHCMYVIKCWGMGAVAVCESWQFGGHIDAENRQTL